MNSSEGRVKNTSMDQPKGRSWKCASQKKK
jgi:hypothetical protein